MFFGESSVDFVMRKVFQLGISVFVLLNAQWGELMTACAFIYRQISTCLLRQFKFDSPVSVVATTSTQFGEGGVYEGSLGIDRAKAGLLEPYVMVQFGTLLSVVDLDSGEKGCAMRIYQDLCIKSDKYGIFCFLEYQLTKFERGGFFSFQQCIRECCWTSTGRTVMLLRSFLSKSYLKSLLQLMTFQEDSLKLNIFCTVWILMDFFSLLCVHNTLQWTVLYIFEQIKSGC